MFKALFTVVTLFISCAGLSQSFSNSAGARSSGIGNSSLCIPDEWSLFNNVGALSTLTSIVSSFSCNHQPSLMGADVSSLVLVVPSKMGTSGIGLMRFGDNLYNEQIITIGYSNSLGLASLGVRLNYIQYHAEGFGNRGFFSINVGSLTQLTPTISIGTHVTNLNQSLFSKTEDAKESVPTILSVGLGIKASDKVFLSIEVEKDLNYKPLYKAGIEYFVYKKIAFRTGYNFHPEAGYFGIGFKPKKFTLDYAFRYQSSLGASHQASVGYILKRKQ